MDDITQTDLPPQPATPPVVVAPAPVVVYPLVEVVDGYTVTTFGSGTVVREPVQRGAAILPAQAPDLSALIDIGPFFDRFGAAKMAVLMSADAGVQAIIKDVQIRKWIDLHKPDVASSIDYIASKVPSVTAELKTSILAVPVPIADNLALRKLYFS